MVSIKTSKSAFAGQTKKKRVPFSSRNAQIAANPIELRERQLIRFANAFPGRMLPDRLEAAVDWAKLQQPKWERYADEGKEWPSGWDMNEDGALTDAITRVLNSPLRDGISIEWLGQKDK